MSAADEAIARVRKIDKLRTEMMIVKDLTRRMEAKTVRIGAMDAFGTSSERRFHEFPHSSASRLVEIANARIDEIQREIDSVRSEFDAKPAPSPEPPSLRRIWKGMWK